MRVLSQDGMIFNDIPYEKFCLGIVRDRTTDKFFIVAKERMASESGFKLEDVMAKYSTEVKARKTMEMLHGVYVAHENYKKLDGDVQVEVAKREGIERAIMYGGIFQFPADDEVEAAE